MQTSCAANPPRCLVHPAEVAQEFALFLFLSLHARNMRDSSSVQWASLLLAIELDSLQIKPNYLFIFLQIVLFSPLELTCGTGSDGFSVQFLLSVHDTMTDLMS